MCSTVLYYIQKFDLPSPERCALYRIPSSGKVNVILTSTSYEISLCTLLVRNLRWQTRKCAYATTKDTDIHHLTLNESDIDFMPDATLFRLADAVHDEVTNHTLGNQFVHALISVCHEFHMYTAHINFISIFLPQLIYIPLPLLSKRQDECIPIQSHREQQINALCRCHVKIHHTCVHFTLYAPAQVAEGQEEQGYKFKQDVVIKYNLYLHKAQPSTFTCSYASCIYICGSIPRTMHISCSHTHKPTPHIYRA